MVKYLTKTSFTLSLLILMSVPVSAKDDVIKVYDKGQDGGMRIYSVACPNGKKTTVTQVLDISDERIGQQELTTSLDNVGTDTNSVKSTAQSLKKKALKFIGQQNRAEMCLYPINSEKQCESYKDVDAAAQAACDLIR
jgi:hypothetical protein